MEHIIAFLYLISTIFLFAWPFSIVSNYLLKKKIISPTMQPDGSGWLSGAVFSSQSSLFGFLSATLVAVLVAQRVQIITSANKESGSLSSLLTLSQTCNQKTEKMTRDSIQQYVQHVIEKEWTSMNDENADWKQGREMILRLRESLLQDAHFAPSTALMKHAKISGEKTIERILDRINDLLDRRIERIQSTRSHIPSYVWAFLYISALLVLMGPSFYAINKKMTHLFLMLAVSTVVCTTLMSIYYLQPRYSVQTNRKIGAMRPEPFIDVLRNIEDHKSL